MAFTYNFIHLLILRVEEDQKTRVIKEKTKRKDILFETDF